MESFVASSIRACIEIRTRLIKGGDSLFTPYDLGFGGDISRGVDLEAEAICYRHLSKYGSVFSEESGWMDPESSATVILDPIDGSDNYVSHFPYYGISIGYLYEGEIRYAVVCNLANSDVFVRTPHEYYRVTLEKRDGKQKIIPNPFAKVGLFEKASEHPNIIQKLMDHKLKFRSPGAIALSLAYAPYVKYMLFLGTMRPYDIQAGLYLSKDLYLFQDDRYILISADKEVFEQVRLIVEKEYC